MAFDRPQALTEIQERNWLRKSASLPLLDIEAELKRPAQRVEREVAFEHFIDSSELYRRAMRRGRYRYTARNNGTFHSRWDGFAGVYQTGHGDAI